MPATNTVLDVVGVEPIGAWVGSWACVDGKPGIGAYSSGGGYLFGGGTGLFNSQTSTLPSVADIPFTPATTVLMNKFHAGRLPSAAVLRPYLDGMVVRVLGNTGWTGGNNVQLQDTNGNLGIYIPTSALQANSVLRFGLGSEVRDSIVMTAASYNSATGAVTFAGAANPFVNLAYVNNAPFSIIGGTGAGQSGVVASNTATVMTPQNGALTFPVAPDNTSIFEFPYWSASAGANTTVTMGTQMNSATPLVANALGNGFFAEVVTGTGVGGSRPVSSNTTAAATVAPAWITNPAAGDLVAFTSNDKLFGCIDYATGALPCFGLGTGLQIVSAASMSAGSNLHISFWGHFGR